MVGDRNRRGWSVERWSGVTLNPPKKPKKCRGWMLYGPNGERKFLERLDQAKPRIDQRLGDDDV